MKAIKTISETYNTKIIVKGIQPDIKLAFEFEPYSISKDIKKIIFNYGIRNHALLYNDKNNSIEIHIVSVSSNSINSPMNLNKIQPAHAWSLDNITPLTQEEIILLAQTNTERENFEQPLSQEQIEQLQNNSNPNDYKSEETPLSLEQIRQLQESEIGLNDIDEKPLSVEQIILLQDSATKNAFEINNEIENSPLTEDQILRLQQNNQ